jgi:hypothetical protein
MRGVVGWIATGDGGMYSFTLQREAGEEVQGGRKVRVGNINRRGVTEMALSFPKKAINGFFKRVSRRVDSYQ